MKTGTIIAGVVALMCSGQIQAQELPMPSPGAKLEQRVGLTDITIQYSRPSAKERVIWGDLVPYDKVWRTGANKNTTITFSHDVNVNGKPVKAGTYTIFTIPGKDSWKVMINSQEEGWGVDDYDPSKDVLSFFVKPQTNAHVESMQFSFDAVNGNDAVLSLSWEKVKISFPIAVSTDEMAKANIEEALAELENIDAQKARVYRNAARYYASTNTNLDQALEWINKSIELNEAWFSYLTKGEVLFAMGDKKGALAAAQTAGEKGKAEAEKEGKEFAYQTNIDQAIAKYK